ncbi:MAG: NAD(P)/FAD-dependent oxidoreductase, partial [bacterium]
MSAIADVVVIGAGIIGCACAYFLARDGHRVVLLDRGDVASGTASASGGWVILHARDEPGAYRLAAESRHLYDVLSEDAGVRILPTGGFCIASSPSELDMLRSQGDRAREFFPAEVLDRNALHEMEPLLAADLAGALYSPRDGVVDPVEVCRALMKRAELLGAQVITHQPVMDIEVKAGQVGAVHTMKERIPAAIVVCAAGVWSPEIGRMVGLEVPVRPRRGHIVRISRWLVTRPMLEFGYEEATRPSGDARGHDGRGLEFVMQAATNGGCLIGSSREFAGLERTPDPRVIASILTRAARFVPAVRDLRPDAVIVGFRPHCNLGRPLIGWAGPRGFLVATGHEGTGITLGPVTGKM